MKYLVKQYKNGKQTYSSLVDVDSHKDALTVHGKMNYFIVMGKTSKIFDQKHKEVKDEARIFKYGEGGKYGILVLVRNLPFKFTFTYKSKRDGAYSTCMELMSAKTVSPKKLPTVIIAFLEETNGIKSTSMSQKTLKDYVESATVPEVWMDTNTVSTSGKEGVRDLGNYTWLSGLNLSLSELKEKTFWVKCIDQLPRRAGGLGANSYMRKLVGKTFEVKVKYHSRWGVYFKGYSGNDWSWKPEWLIPIKPQKATLVKILREGAQDYAPAMKKMVGKIYPVIQKDSEYYKCADEAGHTWWFHMNSVEIVREDKSDKAQKSIINYAKKTTVYYTGVS